MTSPFPISIFALLCALVVAPHLANGFQNPSGTQQSAPDDDSLNLGSASRSRPDPQQLDPSTGLIVDTVRSSKPTTPVELAEAIETMMDLEVYGEAQHYLSELSSLNLSPENLFELNQAVGADFFFRLSLSAPMRPAGAAFAKRVSSSVKETARSPQRINELIGKLSNDNIAIRSDAFRELRQLGEPAVAQMVSLFSDESQKKHFSSVRAALREIGLVGLKPLVAGAVADSERVRLESVLALARINDPMAFDAIVAAYYSKDSSEALKGVALTAFNEQYGYFPDVRSVSKTWKKRAYEMLEDPNELGARRLGFSVAVETLWRWDPGQNALVSQEIDQIVARRIRAADRAEVLSEINPQDTSLFQFNLLTQLESLKQLAGVSSRIDVQAFLKKYPRADARVISQVLVSALDEQLIAAAIGCCQVLEEIGDETILATGSHRPSCLVNAILNGDRHLQHAAVRAIAMIDPKTNYVGSSYVLEAAIYQADYSDRPRVLVGNSREDLARTLASSLSVAGLGGTTANNGTDFYRAALSDANVQYLLVCDTMHRPDYAELVQQLRQHWKTKRTPMAILYRPENQARALRIAREDELTVAMPFTLDVELLTLQIEQLKSVGSVWPVTLDDRRDHSDFAIEWLARISRSVEDYSFYDLTAHQAELGKLIFSSGWEGSASQILSVLGTPESQRILLNYASELNNPVDKRQMATSAFSRSVSANGLLLTREEILQQYDRYNASEKDTPESQKVLGSLLDAIESKRRR